VSEVPNVTLETIEQFEKDELFAFYNANTKRKLKRIFPDLATAVAKTTKLLEAMAASPAVELTEEQKEARAAEIAAKRAAGTSATWQDPEVRAKRTQRHGVEVDGVYYKSVGDAYLQLGLPMSKCIAHRIELKSLPEGTVDEEYGKTWKIVPYRYAEKAKKAAVEPQPEGEAEVQQEAEAA
jgi:hypothetical protein